jgi:hypothetical protein
MHARQVLIVIAGTALGLAPAGAQNLDRRAVMTGGGSPESGRCTAEVVVDGAAEVNIRGDMAGLRDLSGRPPEWRRFECTGAVPPNADVQFTGEGRGRLRLLRAPRDNNGVAVVRIEDSESGASAYRFELSWNNRAPYPGAAVPPVNGRFGTDQAVQVCQDAVRRQAMDRFGAREIVFRRINMDDQPGRNDWVVGMIEMRRPDGMDERRRFSCSVNFDSGRVRSANIEGPERGSRESGADREVNAREMDSCRQAISDRMRGEGYGRVDFGDMNVSSRYGNDWITGTARVRGGFFPQTYDFSCSVTPDGYVRDTNLRRR